MIFFLQGTEEYFVQKEIEKIVKKYQIQVEETLYFSATETTFSAITLEMNSDDIFGMQKMIILKELEQVKIAEFLANTNNEQIKLLQESNNILFISFFREEALTKTLQKELKDILGYATILDAKKQKEQGVVQFLQKELKDTKHHLTSKHLMAIAKKYHNNITFIASDLERIKLEKGGQDFIEFADFKSNSEFLEEQVFDLIQLLETRNTEQIFQVLDNILLHQQNVFGLLALLLKNYKEMYQIQSLSRVGYNMQQIATRLKIHPYRTKLLAKSSQSISYDYFPILLNKIIDTEIALKTGSSQPLAIKELMIYLIAQQ